MSARDDEGEEGEGGLMVWQDKTKASWRPLIGADGFADGAAGCIRRRGDGCQLPARDRGVCRGGCDGRVKPRQPNATGWRSHP